MDDLLKEFLAESSDDLARLDHDVVELERDPANEALLNSIFRTIHTIKGTCGFFGLVRLERVSHTTESVLDLLRKGDLDPSRDVISDILRAVDVVKQILAGIETRGEEPAGDDSLVIGTLESWLGGSESSHDAPSPQDPDEEPVAASEDAVEIGSDDSVTAARAGEAPEAEVARTPTADGVAAGSLRVAVPVLDTLMTLAGELVLARNHLLGLALDDEASPFAAPVQQLNRITADLQAAVMKTRMQPVGSAWNRLPRIVRDIEHETGKRIRLEMSGDDTELDRQLVQALQDPLTHMVRNSADHGIELPEVRRAAGKPEYGTIRLMAYHERGHVIVEIIDDGAGIDPARVRATAIERGLLSRERANAANDADILRYIFEPGFSTAKEVTHFSGRGVGMDVVRNNIERVGGTVELHSARGLGCTIRIRLPLTLAIIPALIVTAAGEAFAVPQGAVLELVGIAPGKKAFDELNGVRLFRLREALIPVVSLSWVLGLQEWTEAASQTLMVCQSGSSRFAVLVDDVLDTQEIVVKPVGRRMRGVGCYAGATILGNGRVIMILDPGAMASLSGLRADGVRAETPAPASVAATNPNDGYLLFDVGETALQAVPLSSISRLEEVPVARIEFADERFVVQSRGALLPLVPAGPGVSVTSGTMRSVIVCNDGNTTFGIAVNGIHDIVPNVHVELGAKRSGVVGTAVVDGRATEIIDVAHFVSQVRGRIVS